MATPKTKSEDPGYDFDNWTEDDETKAILAAVPDVRFIIVERRFVGRLTDGTIIEVPLALSLDEVDELQADYSTPVDQFKAILKKLGGEESAKDFSSRDMVEAAILAEKYFRTLQRVQQAAFPE
ncbi:hypothetical protein DC31_13925 [Microbacterium sp. CH12i]|uniref:hypothetical protein n=1 Tax=Microbacterium sp. CH12i TaxID=1479651 RepID=UPI000461F11E|nr:hypothetical protein [Microbacterium sp. CH12i]KDA05565.1 hypothetical protein DC31_13925 [Microbacterium sp. CH12i]